MASRENPVSARIFDPRRDSLVYIGEKANPALWDSLWSLDAATIGSVLAPSRDGDRIVNITSRYLEPADGEILEGGCGRGQFVAALRRAGFRVIGIDYASATVEALNLHAPELDIRLGDLRSIPLPDASVSGYWSIGVIEHFWNGYDPLVQEMARVVRPGGYLFCSFPFMNGLRALKARLGAYERREFGEEPEHFYQFALRHDEVVESLNRAGFSLVDSSRSSGLKGLLGEIAWIDSWFQRLYASESRSIAVRGIRKVCDAALSMLGTPHSILLVMRRNDTK